MSLEELKKRIDAIEESYEFMLAYAAQGLDGEEGSKTGGELRRLLSRCDQAMTGLADFFRSVVESEKLDPKESFDAFIDVLEQDIAKASAGVRLTLAQPSISSQLVDNLNASIHLRTLLTDIFLVDEIVKKRLVDREKKG
ncbi:MAG TPA: hypothetical protein VJ921_07225 [Vicinamibacteria bacterium]|nr:hypothetical protein [Vicinamibacteria bacterium]